MPGVFDYIVVGSGIIGLSTGYHILRLSPGSSVLVLDRNPGPGMGDTARSAAMFRVFFSSRTNLLLARSSVDFYDHVQRDLGFDLGMRYVGYLFLVDRSERDRLRRALKVAESLGGSYRVVDSDFLSARGFRTSVSGDEEASLLGLEDIVEGVFIPRAGMLDPERLTGFYLSMFRKLGGRVRFNTFVRRIVLRPRVPLDIPGEPFPWQDIVAGGVETSDGFFECRRGLVVATGSWVDQLLLPIGIDPVVRPKKRQIFVVRPRTPELERLFHMSGFNDLNVMPFTILPKRVYVKAHPDEGSFWIGLSDDLGRAFRLEEDPEPEDEFYRYGIYPVLSTYLPQFRDQMYESGWAGHYDINPIDGQPVIFKESNIVVAAGSSGSGIMKADSIGRIAASVALDLDEAELYGGVSIDSRTFSLRYRRVEPEEIIL